MISTDTITKGNYDLITDLAKKIDNLKGYDSGYMLPSSGMMIISHNGLNFMITAEVISTTEAATISDELDARRSRFTSKQKEFELRRINEQEEKGNG